jgi:hypothetical protein
MAEGPRAYMDRRLIWHVLGKMPYHKLFCISPILYLICRLKSTQTTGHDDDEISANKMKNKIQQKNRRKR